MNLSHIIAGVILTGTVAALAVPDASLTGPARVIDGDTLQIGNDRVRLWGIDAPERHQTCYKRERVPDPIVTRYIDSVYPCGEASTAYLQRMVQDAIVTCLEKARDRYSRIVATCSTVDGDLGLRMVANGHAVDYTQYSQGAYKDAEDAARAERLGIWAGTFTRPDAYRREHRR